MIINELHKVSWGYLDLTGTTELQAQSLAASMSLAPSLYNNPKKDRYSVFEFLNGHLLTYEEVINGR